MMYSQVVNSLLAMFHKICCTDIFFFIEFQQITKEESKKQK